MSNQVEVKVLCKFCKRKFTLINTFRNTSIYICVECSFEKLDKHNPLNKKDNE